MNILRNIKLIIRKQSGFTAVELVIGILIIGIIGTATATTVTQVFSGSSLSSNQMTAINNVRNAGDWITLDAQQARPKESIPGSGELLSTATPPNNEIQLIWYDYYPTYCNNDTCKKGYRVIYTIPEGTTNLQRTVETGTWSKNIGFVPDPNQPGQTIIVAQNITSVTRQFIGGINTLTIKITSTVGTGSKIVTESRTFEIKMRPTM